MKKARIIVFAFGLFFSGASTLWAAPCNITSSNGNTVISQYGITWTIQGIGHQAGRFVNGDCWVVGPVTVESADPPPASGNPDEENYATGGNQFGDAALQRDDRMRNGSMVVLQQSGNQGYDSRVVNYDPQLSISFPYTLDANRSLISAISLKDLIGNHNFVEGHNEDSWAALDTAAVLTSLSASVLPVPVDAFRPPYAGTEKPLSYRASQLRKELLSPPEIPSLVPVANTPSLALYERYFERAWLDHNHHWTQGRVSPIQNNPGYGREYARVTSMASLLLLLDIPIEQKEKLLIGFVQLGIDLSGVAQVGGTWPGAGGIWSGRKLPIVFASLLVNDPLLLPDVASVSTRYAEDQQTYYGVGYNGAEVLFQMGVHHGIAFPYEEKDPSTWNAQDQRSEGYRTCCTGNAWVGTALAAGFMRAKQAWGHDAFFDYCDRYMEETGAWWQDRFVTEMWNAYRSLVPSQLDALQNLEWVWSNGGEWVEDTKPNYWGNTPFAAHNGVFEVTFTVVPSAGNIDSVIGLSAGPASGYSALAATVRFAPDGRIDVRNGSIFQSNTSFTYTGGATYHIHTSVDVPNRTYSVSVTPDGGSTVLIASNYVFRTEQSSVTELANMASRTVGGTSSLSNLVVRAMLSPPTNLRIVP